jgi:hypothetical protein
VYFDFESFVLFEEAMLCVNIVSSEESAQPGNGEPSHEDFESVLRQIPNRQRIGARVLGSGPHRHRCKEAN